MSFSEGGGEGESVSASQLTDRFSRFRIADDWRVLQGRVREKEEALKVAEEFHMDVVRTLFKKQEHKDSLLEEEKKEEEGERNPELLARIKTDLVEVREQIKETRRVQGRAEEKVDSVMKELEEAKAALHNAQMEMERARLKEEEMERVRLKEEEEKMKKAFDEITSLIETDLLDERVQLEKQQESLGLGDVLKKPLPTSVTDGEETIQPLLMSTIGDGYSKFKTVLQSQSRTTPVPVVAQASGTGKTKLAYKLGEEWPVLVVRLGVYGDMDASKPWQALIDKLTELGARNLSGATEVDAGVATMRMCDLVAKHIKWTSMVAAKFARRDRFELLRAILFSQRNGLAETGVKSLFKYEKPSRSVDEATRGLEDAIADLRRSLPEDLHNKITVSFDEGQKLLRVPRLSVQNGDAQITLYEIMRRVMRWLQDNRVKTTTCGTWLELLDKATADTGAASRCAVEICSITNSIITASDMIQNLEEYFSLPDEMCRKLQLKLSALQGRPRFFFDTFWPTLWAKLFSHKETFSTREEVVETIASKIDSALKEALEKATEDEERSLQLHWVRSDGILESVGLTKKVIFARLLRDALLNDGVVQIEGSREVRALVKAGIIVCNDEYLREYDFKQEPLMLKALEEIGSEISWRVPIHRDLVLLNHEEGIGSSVVDEKGSVAGFTFEKLVAYWLIRLFRQAIESQKFFNVETVLGDNLLTPNTSVGTKFIDTAPRFGMTGGHFEGSDFAALVVDLKDPGKGVRCDVILHSIANNTGADLAFFIRMKHEAEPLLCLLQLKAGSSSLREALPTVDINLQHLFQKDDRALGKSVVGRRLGAMKNHKDLCTIRSSLLENLGFDPFSRVLRIIVSDAGFTRDAVEQVLSHNDAHPEQEILLLHPPFNVNRGASKMEKLAVGEERILELSPPFYDDSASDGAARGGGRRT